MVRTNAQKAWQKFICNGNAFSCSVFQVICFFRLNGIWEKESLSSVNLIVKSYLLNSVIRKLVVPFWTFCSSGKALI